MLNLLRVVFGKLNIESVMLIVVCFFASTSVYFYLKCSNVKKENNALKAENIALVDDIKRRDKNDVEKSKSRKENEKLAETDKQNFDWHRDISNSSVIVKLRKECRSCAKTN